MHAQTHCRSVHACTWIYHWTKKNCGKSGLDQWTRGCWTMDLLLAKPTLPLLENVLPSSFPTHLAMPCTSPHTESNCRQDGAWSNFSQIKKQHCQAKRQKTSETEQENCRKFESNKRKRAFYPSWKESFCSSSIMLHVRQWTARVRCSATFAEGMIFQVHFQLETQTSS